MTMTIIINYNHHHHPYMKTQKSIHTTRTRIRKLNWPFFNEQTINQVKIWNWLSGWNNIIFQSGFKSMRDAKNVLVLAIILFRVIMIIRQTIFLLSRMFKNLNESWFNKWIGITDWRFFSLSLSLIFHLNKSIWFCRSFRSSWKYNL